MIDNKVLEHQESLTVSQILKTTYRLSVEIFFIFLNLDFFSSSKTIYFLNKVFEQFQLMLVVEQPVHLSVETTTRGTKFIKVD